MTKKRTLSTTKKKRTRRHEPTRYLSLPSSSSSSFLGSIGYGFVWFGDGLWIQLGVDVDGLGVRLGVGMGLFGLGMVSGFDWVWVWVCSVWGWFLDSIRC
ncbi:hypothetical protein Dsin_022837 [Dipteronia sinensis]|uniref:Transmembrane protein n=1 Tax=Dipteronia sinensis TaxID=43782 RepID=A0AAE0E1I9_9ROSI|nr:hypothetical protein Dsin_022837 [Dipteronia sinensis]